MGLAYGNIFYANTPKKEIDFGFFVYGDSFINMISEGKTIIFKKPSFKTKKVKELVTGVEFDYVYPGTSVALKRSNGFEYGCMYGYKSKNQSVARGVVDSITGLTPTKKQVENYIKEHKDIEAYKKFLEEYKDSHVGYTNEVKFIKKRSEVMKMNR